MARRKRTPTDIETEVLTNSGRRCCICYGLNNDFSVKKGQIAHLDHNPANASISNLAWLCFDHHDEYDSTTRQSKGLTTAEVRAYRDQLYDTIAEMRNAPSDDTQDEHSFRITYGSTPSNAAVRTKDQFILLSTRAGGVEDWMLDFTKEVLDDLEHLNRQMPTSGHDYQSLMLRGIWFDDKHGNAVIHIDLLHESSGKPIMTADAIKEAFHDGYGWYQHQGISVNATIIPVNANSDSFFPVSDEFYKRPFAWNYD